MEVDQKLSIEYGRPCGRLFLKFFIFHVTKPCQIPSLQVKDKIHSHKEVLRVDDKTIVALYWERSEAAIEHSQQKYGKYCYRIADNILHNHEDDEECVNDTWVRAWNAMPPERPTLLQAFLGKITRNLALDRYTHDRAVKRGAEIDDVAEEFWQCVPSDEPSIADQSALHAAINAFLATLPDRTRIVFLQRYWYMCGIEQIAAETGLSPANVKVILHRTRRSFKEYLEKEEFDI